MKEISEQQIIETVRELCLKANFELRPDVLSALEQAVQKERSPLGQKVLSQLLANAEIAARERLPICQDSGYVTVFLQIGQEVKLKTRGLFNAVDEGVRQAYQEGFLRKSIVSEPLFDRQNTGDNTPVKLYTEVIPGNAFKVVVMPKGGGSDNASSLKMLTPAEGEEGLKRLVLETVRFRGADACPPLVIGVGVGGSFDSVACLAKKALLETLGRRNESPTYAALEQDILDELNRLGIGPAGLGGDVTALGVHIRPAPTHIGCLPVAVNLSCHALRSADQTL